MALVFNGNSPDNITYNGNPVDKLIFNGNVVYEKQKLSTYTVQASCRTSSDREYIAYVSHNGTAHYGSSTFTAHGGDTLTLYAGNNNYRMGYNLTINVNGKKVKSASSYYESGTYTISYAYVLPNDGVDHTIRVTNSCSNDSMAGQNVVTISLT